MGQWKTFLQKLWRFIWEEDSVWSWIVNVILAFLLIKFIVYPGLGLMLSTKYPIVAVISSSMEHDGNFEQWWTGQHSWYESRSITATNFAAYPFRNGFQRGDIMVLIGRKPGQIKVGEVIVFASSLRPEPIIHRVIAIEGDAQSGFVFQTKGDHNPDSFPFEQQILPEQIYGKAVFRIPLLGYVKIFAVDLMNLVLR